MIYIDIETIPNVDLLDSYIQAELDDFKAPSSLTKTQALKDLGVDAKDPDYKYKTAAECVTIWEQRFADEKSPEVGKEKWHKTGMDGALGKCCSIAWAKDEGEIQSISMANYPDERTLLATFFLELAKSLKSDRAMFVGHNIRFDLKFLYRRCVILGIDPMVELPWSGRHGSSFYCTQEAWAGFKEFYKLDLLCKDLGMAGKSDDIDGSKVWEHFEAGKIAEIEEYNRDDVVKTRNVYKRLNFIK